MKKLVSSLLLIPVAFTMPALALVNPDITSIPVPGWMVEIHGVLERQGRTAELCKGVLIAPQWVLSTTTCRFDPNRVLDDEQGETRYVAKLGPNEDSVGVEEFFQSDDGTIALLRIELPSEATPLPLSTQTSAQLMGQQAVIFGKQTSLPVRHDFYNPNVIAPAASCQVNGTDFAIEGAFCYLLTKPARAFTLYQTRATIINPTMGGAPSTALDRAARIDTSGKQLYLDFRQSLSYPCHEDVGSPVLVKNSTGYEIAGVVVGVGMTGFLPICGMSLANQFVSIAHARKFIDETMASYDFSATCPTRPEVDVFYLAGNEISVAWNPVKGATGYKLHYTTRHGHEPITTLDAKGRTAVDTTIAPGADYLVAVTAYNTHCSSELSELLPVNLDDRDAP
ncbi:MAG: hypothetical protein V4603_14655 [Pseudomonadota bacterium]